VGERKNEIWTVREGTTASEFSRTISLFVCF
jgi:hypothetical protein